MTYTLTDSSNVNECTEKPRTRRSDGEDMLVRKIPRIMKIPLMSPPNPLTIDQTILMLCQATLSSQIGTL